MGNRNMFVAPDVHSTRHMIKPELREKARVALGDGFSIKAFHNLVLETGSVPLEVLGKEVDAWIAAQRP